MFLNTFTPLREPIQYELIFFKWIEMTNKYANVDTVILHTWIVEHELTEWTQCFQRSLALGIRLHLVPMLSILGDSLGFFCDVYWSEALKRLVFQLFLLPKEKHPKFMGLTNPAQDLIRGLLEPDPCLGWGNLSLPFKILTWDISMSLWFRPQFLRIQMRIHWDVTRWRICFRQWF